MLKRFACALAFALAASAAVSGEWSTWPGSNSTYVAVGIEQDGAGLILICDTNRMLVSIGFEEPHARWQKVRRWKWSQYLMVQCLCLPRMVS